ncbi:MAG: UDP-3-O-(3-hydroxymyristoyl)glucosamine N-acyltransferase [Pseudomonadota bacterium]|nr:UDP-3-O-(3-hydroxymyristoyl)glucosamine N-acyltransferase [Pseudomonadota bacterium]
MTLPSFFDPTPRKLAEIAKATGASLPDAQAAERVVETAGPVEAAPGNSISFVDNPKYLRHLQTTQATAVFCQEKFLDRVPGNVVALVHPQPYQAYATALGMLYPTASRPEPVTGETGVSQQAHVGDGVTLEDDVIIEAGAVVGDGASIGRGARILAGAVVGRQVQIGRGTVVGIHVSVLNAFVGDHVILHAGVRIGQDGFGFAMGPGGHRKVAQIGRVIIQDHVEIGANSTVDRGSNRDTVIGEGTKIDNLVQIGHNVVIGRHCILVGHVGIAGSATIGDYVVVAGQAGVVGHVTVGSGAQIGGGAGVTSNVEPGAKVIGTPAMPVRDWVKINMMLKSMIAKPKNGGDKTG